MRGALTQASTEEFNLLYGEFVAAGSGIETVAREWICDEFCFVASAYGFMDADASLRWPPPGPPACPGGRRAAAR
ncbi:DUF5713 family protein [Streptomyces sp. NPDC057781]|uniref:DUF5713 family protein n=1 Tax=unclassified Streptomyces TaxID=2593676 RepID=UPI0036C83C5B